MLMIHFIWQTVLKPLSGTDAKNGAITPSLTRILRSDPGGRPATVHSVCAQLSRAEGAHHSPAID